mmetsp:Transcript_9031/g.9149  ORF Transcript_9031/g.9149 Transcript_9031/m.9149 type:complete len:100 (+) Transcript_9031:403-702(+)
MAVKACTQHRELHHPREVHFFYSGNLLDQVVVEVNVRNNRPIILPSDHPFCSLDWALGLGFGNHHYVGLPPHALLPLVATVAPQHQLQIVLYGKAPRHE